MTKKNVVFVCGHRGMVGSAIVRALEDQGNTNIVTANRTELDLVNQQAVDEFFQAKKISQVYLAAARVGGIQANNTYPANFIYENLMIQANIVNAAHNNGVQRLLFLGSSCIYPKKAAQPMRESALLTGLLEPTNEPYAIAKIAGIKLCESYNRQYGRDYRCVMPTNLYGPNDNYHPENSHVIPGLVRRIHEAKMLEKKEVTIWGSGSQKREFLHVDDMAAACIYVMGLCPKQYAGRAEPNLSHINIGSGKDCSIRDLAELIARVVGYYGKLSFDLTKPDGAPRKLLDSSQINQLGWTAKINLEDGLQEAYRWYIECIDVR